MKNLNFAKQIICFSILVIFMSATFTNYVSSSASKSAAKKNKGIDHSTFQLVLTKFVKDGEVDYEGLKSKRIALDNYLKLLASTNPNRLKSASKNEQLAFYINAYNAITLKRIIDNYPVTSIRKISGVWKKTKDVVAGRELTLDQIEHEILREMDEPRIHFAIVCASGGCPKLQDFIFTADELEGQLDRAARDFFTDKGKNNIDLEKKRINLSKIFSWFGEDFIEENPNSDELIKMYGEETGAILALYEKYAPEKIAEVKKNKFKVKYLTYDWSLNKQK